MKIGPLAGILLLLLTIPAFSQGHFGNPPNRGWSGGGWGHADHYRGPRGPGWGYSAGSGFLGGIVGGLIGGFLAQPRAPQWPAYCYNFRSFNPQTGYWIDWNGQPHFCQ